MRYNLTTHLMKLNQMFGKNLFKYDEYLKKFDHCEKVGRSFCLCETII